MKKAKKLQLNILLGALLVIVVSVFTYWYLKPAANNILQINSCEVITAEVKKIIFDSGLEVRNTLKNTNQGNIYVKKSEYNVYWGYAASGKGFEVKSFEQLENKYQSIIQAIQTKFANMGLVPVETFDWEKPIRESENRDILLDKTLVFKNGTQYWSMEITEGNDGQDPWTNYIMMNCNSDVAKEDRLYKKYFDRKDFLPGNNEKKWKGELVNCDETDKVFQCNVSMGLGGYFLQTAIVDDKLLTLGAGQELTPCKSYEDLKVGKGIDCYDLDIGNIRKVTY